MDERQSTEAGEGKDIAEGLSRLLADTFTLYLQTHNFHWNVRGPFFGTLHRLFEEQYRELWTSVDLIAERIRALGYPVPATYAAFTRLGSIQDKEGVLPANEMVRTLLDGHERIQRFARSLAPKTESAGDPASTDLLSERLEAHEKFAWMLRTLLDEEAAAPRTLQ